ncbi:MAG: discoidin domain-containing protein [Desulfobacteraceae bacterium]|nr:MAG: discoidin domain-containing protein [Desulfobacteraceae bacterium]
MRHRFSKLEWGFVVIVFAIIIGAIFVGNGNRGRKGFKSPQKTSIGTTTPAGQAESAKTNLLGLSNGTVIVSVSSACTQTWKALNLIDGSRRYSWCSAKGVSFPHTIIFELSQPYAIDRVAVDNSGVKETGYPGISSKGITVFGSNQSALDGYTELTKFEAALGNRREVKLAAPVTVQWLKFTVNSNWGNSEYTEIIGIEAFGLPVGPAPQMTVTGVYQTNYGALKIEQDGARIIGCYDYAGGSLSGTLNGRVMHFDWLQEQDKHAGIGIMVLSTKGELRGLWYENGRLGGDWSGVRGGKPPVCKVTK